MAKKKEPLKFERHQHYGELLERFRDNLIAMIVELSGSYGVRTKPMRQANIVLRELDELRNRLDSLVFQENPDLETNEKAEAYYAANRVRRIDAMKKAKRG